MATINLVITDAGLAEIVNAESNGTAPVVLAEIGIGTGQYSPSASQTSLIGEFKRIDTISGGATAENVIHISAQDSSDATYSVYEIGIYTDSGVLFAVCSQNTPIVTKAAVANALFALDIVLSQLNPGTVTVGDSNFMMNAATTERAGIVELATESEVNAGTDENRVVTVKQLEKRLGGHENIVHKSGSENIDGAKTFNSIQINNSSPYIRIGNSGTQKGTLPGATQYWGISFTDSEGYVSKNRLGLIETSYNKSGDVSISMGVYKPEHGNSTSMTKLSVVYPVDGSPYATAPTPASDDNSTKIATTNWVNNKTKEYLPLSGGKMTSDLAISRSVSNGYLGLCGGTGAGNGSQLDLCGKDHSSLPGGFQLHARNSNTDIILRGQIDGKLTWGDKYVLNNSFTMPSDNGAVMLNAGQNATGGAYFRIYGKENPSGVGRFVLAATDGTNTKVLTGKPDGSLTWGGSEIITAAMMGNKVSANGYQKLPSGLIIQWGTNSGESTHEFPMEFPTACFAVVITPITAARIFAVTSKSKKAFINKIYDTNGTSGKDGQFYWVAIGC